MAKHSVFCIAPSSFQAEQIVDNLRTGNFFHNDISILSSDSVTSRELVAEMNSQVTDLTVGGGGISGAMAWIAGIGVLAIPGVGPLIAARPVVAAITGFAIGPNLGGIAGGLIGLGVPEREAKGYENKVKSGRILLSVHSDEAGEIRKAKTIFEKHGAVDLCTVGEKTSVQRHSVAEEVDGRPVASITASGRRP